MTSAPLSIVLFSVDLSFGLVKTHFAYIVVWNDSFPVESSLTIWIVIPFSHWIYVSIKGTTVKKEQMEALELYFLPYVVKHLNLHFKQ